MRIFITCLILINFLFANLQRTIAISFLGSDSSIQTQSLASHALFKISNQEGHQNGGQEDNTDSTETSECSDDCADDDALFEDHKTFFVEQKNVHDRSELFYLKNISQKLIRPINS